MDFVSKEVNQSLERALHSVSQWPNLRNLGEPLVEAVSFKSVMVGMGRWRVTIARWEWILECGGCCYHMFWVCLHCSNLCKCLPQICVKMSRGSAQNHTDIERNFCDLFCWKLAYQWIIAVGCWSVCYSFTFRYILNMHILK